MLLRAGLFIAAIILLVDQASKLAILEWIRPPLTSEGIPITGFFAIVLVWNRGMSFGMLNTGDTAVTWILGAVALAISVALLWWMVRARHWMVAAGLGLILGGAVGNLIDRLIYGAVVDFVLLHAGTLSWPAFNVADSAIVIGVALLLWDSLFAARESTR